MSGVPEIKRHPVVYLFGEKPTDRTDIDLDFIGMDDSSYKFSGVDFKIAQTGKTPIIVRGMDINNLDELIHRLAYLRNAMSQPYQPNYGQWKRVEATPIEDL
jgi:hypothetical protein